MGSCKAMMFKLMIMNGTRTRGRRPSCHIDDIDDTETGLTHTCWNIALCSNRLMVYKLNCAMYVYNDRDTYLDVINNVRNISLILLIVMKDIENYS